MKDWIHATWGELGTKPLCKKQFAALSLLFFAVLMIVFRSFVFSDDLMLNADQLKGIGSRYLSQETILPQWDHTRLGGMPTLDAMFGDAYHPLRLLQNVMDPARAVGWKFILAVQTAFMGGLLLFSMLARDVRSGSIVAALYAFNPQFFTHIYPGHDGKMVALSALPWALWGILELTRLSRQRGAVVLTLSLSYMLLTGHLQIVYFVLWGLLFISLFENFLHNPAKLAMPRRLLHQALIGIAVLAALGSASIQIFPPKAYVDGQSVRGSAEKTSYGHAVSWSIHPEEVASMVLPGFISRVSDRSSPDGQGITEGHYWGRNLLKLNHDGPGILLLLLGILGIMHARLRKQALFWVPALTLTLVYSVGGHTPIFQLFYDILPGVNKFRAPAMAEFWIPMGLAWMAAAYLGTLSPHSTEQTSEATTSGEPESNANSLASTQATLALTGALALLLTVARMAWPSFLGFPSLVYCLLGLIATNTVLYLQASNRKLAFAAIIDGLKSLWKPVPPLHWILFSLPWLALMLLFTGVDWIHNEPGIRDYFRPLQQLDQVWEALATKSSGDTILSMALFAGAIALLWTWLKPGRPMLHALLGTLLIATLELGFTLSPFVDKADRNKVLPAQLDQQWKQLTQRDPSSESFRMIALGGINNNLGPYAKFRSAMGFHDNEFGRYRTFTGGNQRVNLFAGLREGRPETNPFLNIAGIKYIIAQGRAVPNPGAWERLHFLPYAQQMDAKKILARLQSPSAETPEEAWLESNPMELWKIWDKTAPTKPTPIPAALQPVPMELITTGSTPEAPDANASDSAALSQTTRASTQANSSWKMIDASKADRLVMEVSSSKDGYWVFNENWHPDWRVHVNGKTLSPALAFTTFQAIALPAGTHKLEWVYQSQAVEKAKPLVYAGIGLMLGLLGWAVFSGFRKEKAA
jgi:hypothetical protein